MVKENNKLSQGCLKLVFPSWPYAFRQTWGRWSALTKLPDHVGSPWHGLSWILAVS